LWIVGARGVSVEGYSLLRGGGHRGDEPGRAGGRDLNDSLRKITGIYRQMAIRIYTNRSLKASDNMGRSATNWRVKILSALSDPTRLEIIEFLGEEERCVCEIVPAFGRAQSTISKHLAILFEAGILERRIDGKRTLYKVKNSGLFDLLREVDALALEEISDLKKAEKILMNSLR